MASEKEKMQAFKTIGAALFAFGLVCAQLVLSGCGAAPEDEQEIGQTEQPLLAGALSFGKTFGTSVLTGMACLTTTSTAVPCRWMHPYQAGNFGAHPFRYSADIGSIGIGTAADQTAAKSLLDGSVMPAFNGELAPAWRSWDHSQSVLHSLIIRGADSFPAMPATTFGDSNATHYIRTTWGGCQTSDRIETPDENGHFRSCDNVGIEINYPALHNNFAASRFNGNLKQLIFLAMDIAEGAGPQTTASAYTNITLSASQQTSTSPFSPAEKAMVEQVAADLGPTETSIAFF